MLELLAQGRSDKAIATCLVLSERTVESHVRNIFLNSICCRPPGVNRRVRAAVAFVEAWL